MICFNKNRKFTHTELYGVNLKDYCKAVGIDIDTLIAMQEAKIKLLQSNYKRLLQERDRADFPEEKMELLVEIQRTIEQKKLSLKKYRVWQKNEKRDFTSS